MGTKCFRNNAKIQPVRGNFFYNWELWKRTGSFIGNHRLSVTLATLTEFFFIAYQAMLLVGVPFNFGGDRNQLHEMNLGALVGIEDTLWMWKKRTQIRTNFFWWFLFLFLYMHRQLYRWQFIFSTKGFPSPLGLKFSPQYMPDLQSHQWEASLLVTERFGKFLVSWVMIQSVGFLVWITTIIPFIIPAVVKLF